MIVLVVRSGGGGEGRLAETWRRGTESNWDVQSGARQTLENTNDGPTCPYRKWGPELLAFSLNYY